MLKKYFVILFALFSIAVAAPEKWAAEIATLTKNDAVQPPPANAVVFVGSSTIRFWTTLAQDFPGVPTINRGFGGSELADSVAYADRIVIPYHPRLVVLYAGDNDLSAGKTPETVTADFRAFCAKVHAALPETRIIFLSIKPSPSRWKIHAAMERANALIAAECAKDPRRLTFLDVYHSLLGPDGQPRPELFRPDMLHMQPAGYAIWTPLLAAKLKADR